MFPPLHSAIGQLVSCFKELETVTRHRRDYEDLTQDLVALSKSLKEYIEKMRAVSVSEFIENIALRIGEQVQQIEAKRDQTTGRFLVDANEDSDDLTRWYRRVGALFRQLQLDINFSTLEALDEQIADHRLEAMTPVMLAAYNSIISMEINRRGCTKGTRVQVLLTLDNWAQSMDMPNIYWMNGMAGTGKTTIAWTFAQRLKERKILGASFFCTRTSAECGNVGRIIPTIAYQLARYSIPFRCALCQVLGKDRDLGSQTIPTQFEELIMKPLLEVKNAIPEGLVVIIDALDECSHKGGTGLVLDVLFKYAARLPLKFFVTSRPEPHIRNNVLTQSENLRSVFVLHEIESSLVQEDIELYLREELASVLPTQFQVKRLAELSGNLFIYAATAVRYIRADNVFWNSNSTERLVVVLDVSSKSNQKHAEIDDLYATILSSVLCNKSLENKDREEMQTIIWTVVCAYEPLNTETLSTLAGIKHSAKTLAMLQPLYSVLYVSERNNTVSTLHASFPDYILDQTRSLDFHCDKGTSHQRLSQRCFELMEEQLRFNICNLPSSFIADNEVEGLEERIESTISKTLMYACHYWGNHLQNSALSESLFDSLHDFLSRKLLFWMEVLNLKNTTGIGLGTLTAARTWAMDSFIPHHGNLPQLIYDSEMFITKFLANPISCSTPHIYISALPFCPKSSLIFQLYWGRTRGLLTVSGPMFKERGISLLSIWEAGPGVFSLSISPDGTRLAAPCLDGSIAIRDTLKGDIILDLTEPHPYGAPYPGYTRAFTLAFSPDGTRIFSANSSCELGPNPKLKSSICIWNVQNGSLIASSQSMEYVDYLEAVRSAAFSPDGHYVVSASSGGNIIVRDARDCSLAANPLRKHTCQINSVAFSPDGQHIAFGSDDCTVQICSTKDGSVVLEPCEGHTAPVSVVVYSPDGTCIASDSGDGTIRVWNAHDGTLLHGPFVARTNRSCEAESIMFFPNGPYLVSTSTGQGARICVWNICDGTILEERPMRYKATSESPSRATLSLDGSRIISSSTGGTVCVWGVSHRITSASLAATQLEGHSATVNSLIFSPDGAYIVSGSYDRTIRTWSVHDGFALANPLLQHNDPIRSLALSPNNTHIAYGSDDCTIRICDAQSGTLVAGPYRGHNAAVTSIVYSSDGSLIVSGSGFGDHTLRVWRTDGTLVGTPLEGHTKPIFSVAISPSSEYIASGSNDQTMHIWKLQDGKYRAFKRLEHPDRVRSVAFSPAHDLIASGSDASIRIWSAQDGILRVRTLPKGASPITSLAYSYDGSYIVSGSGDAHVTVWNAHDGTLSVGPFLGHTNMITSVACSPDGKHIASGSADKTIRIWQLMSSESSTACSDLPGLVDSQTKGNLNPALEDGFTFESDGWIRNKNSQLLFWVSSDLDFTGISPSLQSPIIIAPKGPITADFTNLLLGEYWNKCYISE
ncbi:unnamed protein product [Rhizoctonia solani]|uniref:NACHT domain-containing protein n=1 Tax=Rhizoctonia solani TaxID=456999 RepID=A0A8H3CNL6_9AGAM|nr:unnamed protein product [Rhizoctonia solani]